jgi:putative membrane-bound dehydrogenase-like protein
MKRLIISTLFAGLIFSNLSSTIADELNVLFMGDRAGHQPRTRFLIAEQALAKRGVKMTYTEDVTEINLNNLRKYDAFLLYANIDRIEPDQEKALLEYVNSGGAFVPIHCATYCFRNSPKVVALMGAQFQRHGTGVFRTKLNKADHPIMKGFGGFESWDETYVHHLHNENNRTVLELRAEGKEMEPWTWVRTQGKGRVFYTAWGHDNRTWGNPGFQNLLERGIRWAAKDDTSTVPAYLADLPFPIPEMTPIAKNLKPFEFIDAGGKIPNYTPGEKWGVQGEAFTKMQKPLEPDEALKHVSVPKDFEVKLFAAEPDIGGKPIAMTWDERGRLWIAETYDYPNELQPVGAGRDRIRILEDTDGDWKADKSTVFAEKLSIPSTMTFHKGGVIVQNGTQTLYLKDTDGDDVADEKKVIFDGWVLGDTHGGVSNFQYGHDNWIWAMQGYNNSSPTINGKRTQSFANGFFRFKPDGSEIEFIRSTNNNTWGIGLSEEGIVFGSTANRNPSVYMPIPNRYYERVNGWKTNLRLGSIADTHLFDPVTKNIRQMDHHGGYTAAAGHALYTARQYPKEYWNRTAFVNGPTGHLVGAFVLKPNSSDFSSTSPFNLFASDDEWSAPIMTEIGPDGNAWVIDWYNYIVQHNPTPAGFKTGKGNAYETPVRDKKRGRIYRVVYKNKSGKPFSLENASPELLVSTLANPTMLWRKQAQRLLVERGKPDVERGLIALVNDHSVDEIGLSVGAIHALWTLKGLGLVLPSNKPVFAAVIKALQHPSAGVRRNAIQVLPNADEATSALLVSKILFDDHPQVRLAALLALSDLPASKDAAATLLGVMNAGFGSDRWLNDASISAAANQGRYLISVAAGLSKELDETSLTTLQIVAEHFARSDSRDSIGSLLSSIKSARPKPLRAILTGLSNGWPKDGKIKMTKSIENDLASIADSLEIGDRSAALQFGRSLGSKELETYAIELQGFLFEKLDNENVSIPDRFAAAKQAIELLPESRDPVKEILDRLGPQTDPALSVGLIEAFRSSRSAELGKLLVGSMDRFTPKLRETSIKVLLARVESTKALLDGIKTGKVLPSELATSQVQALFNYPDREIQRLSKEIVNQGGALPNPDRQKVFESLLPITKVSGNVSAGKAVFKKHCANCHMHSGEGQKIGPDLTGMAVHPKTELLTHIVDPSRDVEGNYRIYKFMTIDGLMYSGLLASESKTTVEIYDAEGKKNVLLREDVEKMVASKKSLMPEGFEKQIDKQQMTDLLEFLTARGKFLPLDIAKAASLPSDRGMFVNRNAPQERLIFKKWGVNVFNGVPFNAVDPQGGKVNNAIVLHGPNSEISRSLPRRVSIPCNGPVKTIHMLSGVSGWGYPFGRNKSVSLIVRIHFADGSKEDLELKNGVEFADYIRREDVPGSEFADLLKGGQIRYLSLTPKSKKNVEKLELIKGNDATTPVVMAMTIEGPGE